MKYLLKKEFLTEAATSKSTLYSFYNKHPKLWDETKLTSNRRLIPVSHIKYFSLKEMIADNDRKELKIEELKSFLDHIRHCDPNDELGSMKLELWRQDWDIFCTVSYRHEMSRNACREKMSKLFKNLEHHYLHKTNLRMFFNTEEYEIRRGHHNHFIIHCSNKAKLKDIEKSIRQYFSADRLDIKPYDPYQAGSFYLCKDGLDHEYWDDWEF